MKRLARGVAIWLSAILFCLSVAAPAHSLEHFDDGAKTHCTLCIQKVQLNSLLPISDFSFTLPQLAVESYVELVASTSSTHVSYFQSRAPPSCL
ncbi:ABC-type zinc uptake system zinc chaperone [Shewanella mesophila]|uniref:ABC-type zinc uptake system zinc chaperone n=1 Tax=Shewanella mesophila TaxID=2864208 RepID=UPI0021AB9C7B|nr:ABC-type zinc uptake system zinc chaperone [Shewanella mesophila]